MPKQEQIARGYPLSMSLLPGGKNSLRRFLGMLAMHDVSLYADDFLGDTINLDYWALANSGGAGAANFAINVQQNGAIRGTTGTTDNGSLSAVGPLIYSGDKNCGIEVRFKSDVVTNLNFEVGFIDAVPGADAGGITDIDTPALGATDAALLSMDTDQTLTAMAFVTKGTAIAAQKTNTTGVTAPTAATYLTARIELRTNAAKCWINGVAEASHDVAIEGGTAIAPWIYVRTRDTTTHLFDIDYVMVWQDR